MHHAPRSSASRLNKTISTRKLSEKLPAANGTIDPLALKLMRHRGVLLAVYLSILTTFLILVLAANLDIFPEILHALFALVADPSSQWEYWRNIAGIFTNSDNTVYMRI